MRRYDRQIKQIKKVYDAKLKELFAQDKEAVLAYIWYNRIHKKNITKERKQEVIKEAYKEFQLKGQTNVEFISFLLEKQEKVKDILQEFKTVLVRQLAEKGTKLHHVTRYSPKEINYVLKPSLAETIYNESIGNYLFASLEEVSKLGYAVRTSTGGMFRVGENMIVFPTNNNIHMRGGRLCLKKPIYSYELAVDNFEPVITVRIDYYDKKSGPSIVFDDEWVCSDEIDVNEAVCIKIEEVTELLEYFKVFAFNNNNFERNAKCAFGLTSKTKRDADKALKVLLAQGEITFINAEIKRNLECVKK